MQSFQDIILNLSRFWAEHGCLVQQGYDLEVGAGTFNPSTFLRCLGPEPYRSAYLEPSRRPADGRFGENPNRLQHFFQYQVVLKPAPVNIQELYLESLVAIGVDLKKHDIRFVHDDWESPTLGAWGLGWEVWMDGMEITQFTYFQQLGGLPLKPVTGEITYGIERIAMYLHNLGRYEQLPWNERVTYGELYKKSEEEWSHYNFTEASTEMWFRHFDDYEREAKQLMERKLPIPAYDFVMKASHAFNLLDARGAISVTERAGFIARIRDLSREIAECYVESREEQGFPLIGRFGDEPTELPQVEMQEFPCNPEGKGTFLLEIGCEELPATFVPIGCRNLERDVRKLLQEEGITHGEVRVYGTPRRLAIQIQELSEGKPAVVTERKGPPLARVFDESGQPTKAGAGFLRSMGVEGVMLADVQAGKSETLTIQQVKGVDYLFGKVETPGRATKQLLAEKLPALVLSLDFPKRMRWADLDLSFARPLQWAVALWEGEVVPFAIGPIVTGNRSRGHRQLAPEEFEISSAREYVEILRTHQVMVDIQEREKEINSQLAKIEKELGAQALEKEAVMAEVLHLVEWPMLTVGEFDEAFLKAPKEVLVSEMVEHQRYFPLSKGEGLLPRFVITANNTPSDDIRRGNQRVLSARLSDGVFLYQQDLEKSFAIWNERLKNMTFHRGLGSIYDKMGRLVTNVEKIHARLGESGGDLKTEKRAAELCKGDLASDMVYEFPELQGVMGRYYAKAWGETDQVAQAIDEHWMPRGEEDPLPESREGAVVSLADKTDNLLACFLTGRKPTSSKDPHGLRRQVLGLIRTLIDHQLYLPLMELFKECAGEFGGTDEDLQDLEHFVRNRIRTVFQQYGFAPDEIAASLGEGVVDIYDIYQKVAALHQFRRESEEFPHLVEVYKRAKGQIGGEGEKAFREESVVEEAEKELVALLGEVEPRFHTACEGHDYEEAYRLVAKLQRPLARLFDEVRILCDDEQLKNNRIGLLQRVFGLFGALVDFGQLQHHKEGERVNA